MIVEFTEYASTSFIMSVYEMYPEANSCDFDNTYRGEVIGTTKNFWGVTYLTIACEDNQIRECEISKAKIIKS